jgi:hypothetical protein
MALAALSIATALPCDTSEKGPENFHSTIFDIKHYIQYSLIQKLLQ